MAVYGNIAPGHLFSHPPTDTEHEMQRLLSSLALLLIATFAYAQDTAPVVPTQEAAGTRGDTVLITVIAIAFVVVAVGVFLFIRRGGRTRM